DAAGAILDQDNWVFGGWGTALALALLALLRLTLPPAQTRTLRFPLMCVLCNGVLVAIRSVQVALAGTSSDGLQVVAMFVMLLALGRLGFLLVVEVGLSL